MEDTWASSVSLKDINDQIVCLLKEIQGYKGLIENASENTRQDIKEIIKCKENMLADLQCKVQSTTNEPRRSERTGTPTEKKLLYQKDEVSEKEKRLTCLYEQWKI